MTPQAETVLRVLIALVLGLPLGCLWNHLSAKRAKRAELPVEWRDAIERTYGRRE